MKKNSQFSIRNYHHVKRGLPFQKGYVALSSILVILAVTLAIGISTSLLSINDALSSVSGQKGNTSMDIIEGCVEDALIRLNEDNSIPSSLVLPQGTCTVTINSQVGNNWDFTVSASINSYTRSVRVQAVRSTTVSITSWQEI